MARKTTSPLGTDKRIRLGVWGLGRGMDFYRSCAALNIDVVAGCDFNDHMRERFQRNRPGAFVTDDAAEFLAQDIDAVLLATFCPNHAQDAIDCLHAGKHVLSEVTSFHTVAEGVKLVETVEKTGLVYNLAENYPFSAANMYLAKKWSEGLFGELMYAEYEYVHEVRSLQYTYIDGVPVQPGWTVHNWRSWLNFHYYNTHSLGPVMHITGLRPVRIVSLPVTQSLPGNIRGYRSLGGVAPSLISMENGAVMRNLMGATTNDTSNQRLWGTKGSSEIQDGKLRLRLGGSGLSPKMEVEPKWEDLSDLAEKTGHGGGDFWILYYFAREILFGEPAPFDIYRAADCTLPGILAYRSAQENGKPFDIPDLRKRRERDRHRKDALAQERYDIAKGCFPRSADRKVTARFTSVMKDLIHHAETYRNYKDWIDLAGSVRDPSSMADLATRLLDSHADMVKTIRAARKLANAYPRSDGGRVLREMLAVAGDGDVLRTRFPDEVRKNRARLKRLAGSRKTT